MTFGQFAELFHQDRKNTGIVEEATLSAERTIIRALNQYLEDVALIDIDVLLLKEVMARMVSVDGKSISRMHDIVMKLKQIMKEAVVADIIIRDPTLKIKTPAKKKPIRKSLKQKEAIELYSVLAKMPLDRNTVAVYLGLATGMRRGEILGLFWEDVDLEDKTLNIAFAIDVKKNRKAPKSDAGIRRISIDDETVSRLKKWQQLQSQMLLANNVTLDPKTAVCSNAFGGVTEPSRFYNWFKNFCVDNGFGDWTDPEGNVLPKRRFNKQGFPVDEKGKPYSRSNKQKVVRKRYIGLKFHELRHTQATLLIANGVDIKTVQSRLGHSRASMTLDFYAHAQEKQDRAATTLFSELLKKA
jgi:integrase